MPALASQPLREGLVAQLGAGCMSLPVDRALLCMQAASAAGAEHIHFEGDDGCRVSIPIDKAMSEMGDVLLAYEMNGDPIPLDHGEPHTEEASDIETHAANPSSRMRLSDTHLVLPCR